MSNLYNFTDRNLKKGLKIVPDSHNIIHSNSISTILPIYTNFGIETRFINKT